MGFKNFEKPLEDFTEEELQRKMDQIDPRFAELVSSELLRRLQKENTKNISSLVKIVKDNTETTNKTTRSTNRLAKIAIIIALTSFIVQVIFSIHQESWCAQVSVSTDDPNFTHFSDCFRNFDLGVFGKFSMNVADYKIPIGQ